MTPTRLREIAQQLVNNCSAYQETVMQVGAYRPCKTCARMAEELREYAKKLPIPISQRTSEDEAVETEPANI